MLLRQSHKPHWDTWGIPWGKVDSWEDVFDAMKRELQEETGIVLTKEDLEYKKTFQVHNDAINYHMFVAYIDEKPVIVIEEPAHKDFIWLTPENALKREDLMLDMDRCIEGVLLKD